jgi:acetyltransferase-like isoleucine patch superfamily enzyme
MRTIAALAISVLPSSVKVLIYRVLGWKVGKGVHIGIGTVILADQVEIGDGARIGHLCLIRVTVLRMGNRASISNLVRATLHTLEMRSQSTIHSQNQVSGDRSDPRSLFYLGPASAVLPMCFIDVSRAIRFGRNVGVGGGSYLFTHGYWLSKLDGFPVTTGEITMADDVWLPWGCFVMPNVTIGSRVVVGARAVINKSLPAGVLAAGVPAKVIRDRSYVELTADERMRILDDVTESAAAKAGLPFAIDRQSTFDAHSIGGRLTIMVHRSAESSLAPLPTLNVVFSHLADDGDVRRFAMWSLEDYSCSPFSLLSRELRDWFTAGRAIGLRYYPIDEDLI